MRFRSLHCLLVFISLVFASCSKTENEPTLTGTWPADLTINDTLLVPAGNFYDVDADGDSIKDFRIKMDWWPSQHGTNQTMWLISLNPNTKIDVVPATASFCYVPDTVGGYAGQMLHNCGNSTATPDSTVSFSKAVLLDSTEFRTAAIHNSGKDTATLFAHYTWFSAPPYPNFVNQNYSFGTFASRTDGYLLVSANGQRYAYHIRYAFPHLLILSRHRLS